MASARKRGDRWTGLYRDADGKQKSAGTFDTEKTALKAAEAREAIVRAGGDPSVLDKATLVYATHRRGKITVAA